MINSPKITIITPSYNQGHFIEQTIQSVLNQHYPNLEYIIIDGGSTDNTVEIIKKYEDKITYWISEPDKGQSDAINKGLKIATGDIINWLNSDDYYEPNALSTIANEFVNNPNAKVVCARSRIFKNENETVFYSSGTDVYFDNLEKTIAWARIDQPETFFHKSAIEKMGVLDVKLKYLMDRDWWIKYLLNFGLDNIVRIDNVIVNFRLHNESKTVSQGDLFQKEFDSWFYNLAKYYKLSKYSEFINSNFEIKENINSFNINNHKQLSYELILNYYLLLRAIEIYENGDRAKTNKIINFIKIDNFDLKNKLLYCKVNLNNKLYLKKLKSLILN